MNIMKRMSALFLFVARTEHYGVSTLHRSSTDKSNEEPAIRHCAQHFLEGRCIRGRKVKKVPVRSALARSTLTAPS